MSKQAKITERGWGGHFILAHRCLFRRNTLVEGLSDSVVVSTVGGLREGDTIRTIGAGGRYYETMVFGAVEQGPYIEADVSDERGFDLKSSICADSAESLPEDVDNQANDMHEAVVAEFANQLGNQNQADPQKHCTQIHTPTGWTAVLRGDDVVIMSPDGSGAWYSDDELKDRLVQGLVTDLMAHQEQLNFEG